MREQYILYLIFNKSGKMLKIGKTRESFKKHRYSKIKEDFGALFDKSYYITSYSQAEIDNLERILHKTFYKERRATMYKTGVGKTEWFNGHIINDVKKHIVFLKNKNKNFQGLSKVNYKIDMESSYRIRYKLRAMLFALVFISGFLLSRFIF